MAFNFNGLSQVMGQTNIFDPQNPNQQNGVAPQPQTNLFATSAGGLAAPVSGPSGGVASANPSAKQIQTAPNAGQMASAFAQVKGTDTSKAVGGIESNIKTAQDKLQAKANEYGAKTEAAKANSGLSQDTIAGAISGNDKAFQDTAARLQQTSAKPVEAFVGLDDKELPTLADPLQYEQSWGEIFRPQAGASYTSGQSDFEDVLLGRGNQFRTLAASLGQKQNAVLDQNKTIGDTETKKAQDILNADWTAQTDAIRGQLSGEAGSIVESAKAREAAEEARRGGLSKYTIQDAILKGQRPLIEDVARAEGYGDYKGGLDDSNAYNGLTNYITLNQDVNYKDLVSEDEAGRFNRIQGLLGNGDMLQAGSGAPADYSYDQQRGNDYIQEVLRGKAKDQSILNNVQNEQMAYEAQEKAKVEAAQAQKDKIAQQVALAKAQAARLAAMNKAAFERNKKVLL